MANDGIPAGKRRTAAERRALRLQHEADEQRAFELRRAGASFSAIAATIRHDNGGPVWLSANGAWKAYQRHLRRRITEPTEEQRGLELERLDALQMAHWNRAVAGDAVATRLVLDIIGRRSKLNGLDAPVQVEHLLRAEAKRMAEETGLSEEEILAETERILAGIG